MTNFFSVVMCGDPGQVGNASRQINGVFQYRASVNYSCNIGFILLSGDVRRTCLAYGNWSGVHPVCQGMFTIQFFFNFKQFWLLIMCVDALSLCWCILLFSHLYPIWYKIKSITGFIISINAILYPQPVL